MTIAKTRPTSADATSGAAGNAAGAIPAPMTVPWVHRYKIRVRFALSSSKRADPNTRPNSTIINATPPHSPTLPARPVALPATTALTADASKSRELTHATGSARKPRIAAHRRGSTLLSPIPRSTGAVVDANRTGIDGGGATLGKIAPMFRNAD